MASGKYDPGYSFDSDHSDTWRQRHGTGRTAQAPVRAADRPARRTEADKPDPRACPGECNRRYREAWAGYATAVEAYDPLDPSTSRPGSPEDGCWLGDPVWCPECAAKIARRLGQLDILAGILGAAADGHRPSAEPERVSGSSKPPSPSQAADNLDEMFSMLSNWETIYRALKGWSSGPPSGELASRETECVNWLQRHLRGILASDIAADFGREILQWHRESTGSAKAGVRTLRKPMRCPTSSCRQLTLFWTEGEKDVYCKNPDCGRVLSLAEYEAEAERQAAILQRGEDDEEMAS